MAAKPHLARYRGGQQIISLEEMDQTKPAVQRALALRGKLLTERGGAHRLSAIRLSSVDIFSCITAMVEDQLAGAMNGIEIDQSALNSLLNSRRREAELIGVDPGPVDVTPTLDSYLEKAS